MPGARQPYGELLPRGMFAMLKPAVGLRSLKIHHELVNPSRVGASWATVEDLLREALPLLRQVHEVAVEPREENRVMEVVKIVECECELQRGRCKCYEPHEIRFSDMNFDFMRWKGVGDEFRGLLETGLEIES